jgi:hypothetical protein
LTGGRKIVSYRVDGGVKRVPAKWFAQHYHQPELLTDIWRGERPTWKATATPPEQFKQRHAACWRA